MEKSGDSVSKGPAGDRGRTDPDKTRRAGSEAQAPASAALLGLGSRHSGQDRSGVGWAISVQRLAGNQAMSRMLQPPQVVQRWAGIPDLDVLDLPQHRGDLAEGSTGSDVSKVQRQLNINGANPRVAVDGAFGPKTRAAVLALQRATFAEPAKWSGKVDGETWNAVFNLAAGAGPAGDAAYKGAIEDHLEDLERLTGFIDAGLKSSDVMTSNSCEQVTSHRMKVYALTPTDDSAARAAAAGSPGGVAYFSYPGGALYEAPVPYAKHASPTAAWDNKNVHIEQSPDVDGFQDTGVIALMQSAIKKGKDYFLGVLRHEVQHFVDDHGDTALEGYKTEFRAYWLGSREYNGASPTAIESHKGYHWNARQWAIFSHLYGDADYAYVKSSWDAESALPVGSRPFQQAVVAFTRPDSVNRHNSVRVTDFDKAIRAVTSAACGLDTPASPNALVTAVRQAHSALKDDDRSAIRASSELQNLIKSRTSGQLLKDLSDVIH